MKQLFFPLILGLLMVMFINAHKKHNRHHNKRHRGVAMLQKAGYVHEKSVMRGHHVKAVMRGETEEEEQDTNFPDLMSFFGTETTVTETGREYKLFGCVLEVDNKQCNITFTPKEKSCHDKLSIPRLFDFIFKKADLRNMTKKFIPLENFQIKNVNLNKCNGDVELNAISKEAFDIVKKKLKVKTGSLEMNFNYKELKKLISFEKIGLKLEGVLEIVGVKAPLNLDKKKDSSEGFFSIKMDSISANEFSQIFSKKGVSESEPQNSLFTDVIISDPIISGIREVDGSFEIVMKGKANGIQGFGPVMVFLIIQKQNGDQVSVAFVADIKNVNPTKVLSAITGKNLTDIPIIKHITVNLVFEFATNDMMLVKDEDINKVLIKYISNAKTVMKGTKLKLHVPIKKILQNTKTIASLKHVPESMFVEIYLHEGDACFRFPDNATMDLLNIMVALIPNVPDVLFKYILKTPPRVIIKKFDVDIETQKVDLLLLAPKQVILGDNLISLETAEFELQHKAGGEWQLKIKAEQKIGKSTLKVLVQKINEEFVFSANVSDLTTKELVKQFGAPKSERFLEKLDFLNFGLKDLQVFAKFGEKLKIHIKGNPVLFGWDDIYFEGFIYDIAKEESRFDAVDEQTERKKRYVEDSQEERKPEDDGEEQEEEGEEPLITPKYDRMMTFGVVAKHIRLDEIAEKLFNKSILRRSWLSDLSASLTISNTDATSSINFTLPELTKHVQLREGTFFVTQLTIPKDCKGDKLCEIAREKMIPGTKFYLEGEVTKNDMLLKGNYKGGSVKLGKNVVLHKVVVFLKIGRNGTALYIEGDVKINDPPLIFRGYLNKGVLGNVELLLTMVGMWKKPFGIPFIAFRNIRADIGVYPELPMTKLGFTGELHIGNIGSGQEIKTTAAIGINPINPLDDFFFADMNNMTIESLAIAFGLNLQLPKVLLDSGFPGGLLLSYTINPKGKEIEQFDTKIKMGVQLRGLINILGLKLKCNILVNYPLQISVDVEMSPLKIGNGLISLKKSRKDQERGPQLYVEISSTEVEVQLHAYAEMLGIADNIVIHISNKGMHFFIYGNLFDLVETNVTVSAPFSKGEIMKSDFMVTGCISASISDISISTVDIITSTAENTEDAIKTTNKLAKIASSWHDKANNEIFEWTKSLEEKQEAIQRKSRKLDQMRDVVDDECVDECEDVCLGGPSIDPKCYRILGYWIPCPVWDECKVTVEDPTCLTACKVNQLYLEGRAFVMRAAIDILLNAIAIIEKLLEYAKGFVDHSKVLVDAINSAAHVVELATKSAERAMYAVENYRKEDLINLHHICFNTTLEQAASACFGIKVNVTLGGIRNYEIDTQACMDMNFAKNIGEKISETLFDGLNAVKGHLDQAKKYFSEADQKKKELEEYKETTEKAEHELEGGIDEETIRRDDIVDDDEEELIKKKEQVHRFQQSRSKEYVRQQIYTDLPTVFIHDDLTMDALDKRSPWAFSRKDSPFVKSKNSKRILNDTSVELKEYVPLDFDELEDPEDNSVCEQSKRVVSTYTLISSSINRVYDKLKEERQKYQDEARGYVQKISNSEKELLRKCRKANVTTERSNEAMFIVKKVKAGMTNWIKNVDHQIEMQDEEFLKLWRESLSKVITSDKNPDTAAFVRSLHGATNNVVKRHRIPRHKKINLQSKMASVSKIVKELLIGKLGSLSSKSALISKLKDDVEELNKEVQLPCFS